MSDSIGSRNRLPRSPLGPAEKHHSPCADKTMTLHTQTLATTFTNGFCACQLSPFTEFRTLMRRHIAIAVIKHFSNLHLKNEKACNCDNLRAFSSSFYFPYFLLFISHLIKKTGQKNCTMYACNSIYI